ncbi:hypothetical protein BJ165DRAFT_1442892 [Panaeolus papilionaceus]|nr:hypothetical protein BJ165DRAFT_1442892 [Panaeolus papilionaceus]
MDLQFIHPTQIYSIRPSRNTDANDLVAIGGEHSVDVIQLLPDRCHRIASFHIGCRVTALAWSSRTVSPSSSENWVLELTAAVADYGLHLLTKAASSTENVFSFGGGLSGHHGKINDMTFCGGWDEDSMRYLATVSDDKNLMVWDLNPTVDINGDDPSNTRPSPSLSPSSDRPQPLAYAIPFAHPLTSIRAHPGTNKEFLVSDCFGSVFLTDWRADPEDSEDGVLRHSSILELIEPESLAASVMGGTKQWSASVDWRPDAIDIVGGVYNNKFVLWDISKLQGGVPTISNVGSIESGAVFRWCPTYPEHFAISSRNPTKGAVISVFNCNYIHAQPSVFNLQSRPLIVSDFDFLSTPGIPRIVAAVGKMLRVFLIGTEA